MCPANLGQSVLGGLFIRRVNGQVQFMKRFPIAFLLVRAFAVSYTEAKANILRYKLAHMRHYATTQLNALLITLKGICVQVA